MRALAWRRRARRLSLALNIAVTHTLASTGVGTFWLSTGTTGGAFTPFPMAAPQTRINGQGKLEFTFPPPNNESVFRLEAR